MSEQLHGDLEELSKALGVRTKTAAKMMAAYKVLQQDCPMTLRQVFYRMVAAQILPNNVREYKSLGRALVKARQAGLIPWDWMEDRLRQARTVPMYGSLSEYWDIVMRSYRRDVWQDQPALVEAWLEKDALSGIFLDELRPYGVTLNVGRGYDGWSSIERAARRYESWGETVILYFGDMDPSGQDMVRSLGERLAFFGCDRSSLEIIKSALTLDDIEKYELPPDFAKRTDSRSSAYIAEYGDIAVELDALPPRVLRERIIYEVESYMDINALDGSSENQRLDIERLRELQGSL